MCSLPSLSPSLMVLLDLSLYEVFNLFIIRTTSHTTDLWSDLVDTESVFDQFQR